MADCEQPGRSFVFFLTVDMDRNFRNKITYAGFILSIPVIWVHAVNTAYFGVSSNLQEILAGTIGQIAVPGFFILSGYLFFRGFELKDSSDKLKRRVRSVLIPYFLWNIIYYILYLISGRVSFDIVTVLKAVFLHECNPVFWYMQQLIVLFLISPVICVIIRRMWSGILLLAAIALLIAFDVTVPFLNPDALFYYTAAGMAAYYLKGYAESDGSIVESLTGLVFIALGVSCVFLAGYTSNSLFIVLMRTLCPVGLWVLIPAGKLPDATGWMKCSFMVYAMHFAFVKIINYAGAFLLPHELIYSDILYLAAPAMIIAAVCGICALLKRYAPKLLNVMSGHRL